MAISAHDVARELRKRLPDAGVAKIHKLLYYCQGWYAAWNHEPMFTEPIEAWDNGPVVAALWHIEDKGGSVPAPQLLTNEMLVALDYVVSRYGRLSGRDLIELTHSERPWRRAYEPIMNIQISFEDLVAYFSSDDEQNARQTEAAGLLGQPDFRRIVEAVSRPLGRETQDDTEALRRLLESLAG